MTPEQQKALAIARARRRRTEGGASASPDMANSQAAAPQELAPWDVRDERGVPGGQYAPDPVKDPNVAEPNAIDYLGRKFAEGAVSILGLPVDLVNIAPMAANLLPGVSGVEPISPKPMLGGQFFRDALNNASDTTAQALGMPIPSREPTGPINRVAGRVAEELGGTALPVGGLINYGARVGQQAAREGNALSRMFVEPAAVDPRRFATRELTTAAGAGLGAGAAGEAARGAGYQEGSGGSVVADILGALSGATATGLASSVGRGVKETGQAILGSPNYSSNVVRDTVTDMLAEGAGLTPNQKGVVDTQSLVDQIMGGHAIEQVVPGYQPSLADVTQNPSIASMEFSRQSGPNAGQFIQQRANNTAAVDNAMENAAPQGSPGVFRNELEARRDVAINNSDEAARLAQEQAAAAVQPITPTSSAAQRGDVVRGALEEARDTARNKTSAAYDAVGMSGRTADPVALNRTLQEGIDSLTEVEKGLIPQGVIDRVARLGLVDEAPVNTGLLDASGAPIQRAAPAPAPIDLKEATDLQSELRRLQRAAMADPRAERGGRNAARVLEQMVERVDNFVGDALGAEGKQLLDNAKAAKFDEAERFTRAGDPVTAALARREGGMPAMRDDRVAGSFVDPQSMDRLFAQADTPAVRQAIRDEVLSKADASKAERLANFKIDYAEQIKRFPGLEQELDTAISARSAEAAATASNAKLRDELTKAGRSNVASYLKYGDENADRAMRSVMNSAKPKEAIGELLDFVGNDPAAVAGAQRTFWDVMEKSSRSGGATTAGMNGAQPWLPNAMKNFMSDPRNKAVAERLYRDNPEHWKDLEAITDALQGTDLRVRAKAPNTSGTAQSTNNVLTPETIQSRILAYKKGQIGGSFLLTSMVAVVARRSTRNAQVNAVNKLLDDALLNPKVAATLLKENNPANRAALRGMTKTFLGNEASSLFNALSAEDEDPTVKKVMQK